MLHVRFKNALRIQPVHLISQIVYYILLQNEKMIAFKVVGYRIIVVPHNVTVWRFKESPAVDIVTTHL